MVETQKTLSDNIAVIAVLGALYVAIGLALPFISFGLVQCRVSDSLYPLICLFGLPSVIGLTLGQFIYNLYGFTLGQALGVLDLLSPLVFLPAKLAIMKWGGKAVPLHVVSVALWVSYLLNLLFGLPFSVSVCLVGIGEAIAEIGLGIPLMVAVKRRMKK